MSSLSATVCCLIVSCMKPNSRTHPYWSKYTHHRQCFEVEVKACAHTSNFYNKLHTYDYMKCINYTAWINSVKNKKLSAAPAWLLWGSDCLNIHSFYAFLLLFSFLHLSQYFLPITHHSWKISSGSKYNVTLSGGHPLLCALLPCNNDTNVHCFCYFLAGKGHSGYTVSTYSQNHRSRCRKYP